MNRPLETGTEFLRAHVDDLGVLRIVLDNRSRHNSLTAAMLSGLQVLHAAAADDDEIKAVLVRGAGTAAFASGADIEEQADRAATGRQNPDRGSFVADLLACPKPVVAMINGYCLGGGLLLAMTADLRIAAEDSQFGIPATRLGVAYPLAGIDLLVELIGRGAATEVMLTGDRFDANRAREMGLITSVSKSPDLEERTEGILERLVSNAPLSLATAKASIRHANSVERAGTSEVIDQIDAVWASADAAEGMAAFLERRPPSFEGR